MTKDNLLKSGTTFVGSFTKAIIDEINKQQK
jgi:hypothetical protein